MQICGDVIRKEFPQKINLISQEFKKSVFTMEAYLSKIEKQGLKNTWKELIDFLFKNGIEEFNSQIINFYDIGKLYEIGLAHENKFDKKQCGKYYTPKDVSAVMAKMICQNENLFSVADIGCGCGNLMVAVLEELENSEKFKDVVENGIYLFDNDETALEICCARIMTRFNIQKEKIHKICGDFLSMNDFPSNLSVIANPPYVSNCRIKTEDADVNQAGDLYIAFFSKICDFAQNITIVTPQSFIVGQKFSMFREKLYNNFYGDIFSFDNVPCPLFNGKKEGIFNTNNANGVRASISNFHRKRKGSLNGFRLSHLVRFKSEQREKIIDVKTLENTLGTVRQDLIRPIKAFRHLENFAFDILKNSYELSELLSEKKTDHSICVATSARYFISASKLQQKRSGFFELYAKDKKSFNLLYALLNSSYCYMWYRFFDGGILLPKALLKKIPVPKNLNYDEEKLNALVLKIIATESNFKSYKKNGGAVQEVIKFPESTRNELNDFLFDGINFLPIHKNYEEI